MNLTRRNLFRSLTAVVVASSMEVMGWKVPKVKTAFEYYRDAEYEECFIYHPAVLKNAMWINPIANQPFPTGPRFDLVDGNWIRRPNPSGSSDAPQG